MKQIVKNYLYLKLVTIITTLLVIISVFILPILYINNILFAILYFIIACILIILGIYKIANVLYNKLT